MATDKVNKTEELDELLRQEDPEFARQMDSLKIETKNIEIKSVELALEGAFEEKPSLKNRLHAMTANFSIKDLFKYFFIQLKIIWRTPFSKKIAVLVILILLGVVMELALRNLRGTWIPTYQKGFIQSFDSVADHVMESEKMLLLDDALPLPEYQVLLEKVVVNLKRIEGSNANPMGTFEIYAGAENNETAIELRARKNEMIDVVSRAIEDLTYADITQDPKNTRLKDTVLKALNSNLSQGSVRRVYLKTNITKP